MKGRIVWVVVSCLMVAAMVLASCAPAVTEEKEVVTPPTEKEKEVVTPPTEEKEVAPAGPEMVKVTLKKLDGTVVEKMMEKPKYGGTVTTLCDTDPNSFDPIDQMSGTCKWFMPFVYDKLEIGDYVRSPNGTNECQFAHFFWIRPEMRTGCIAESWEQPDPLTYIWHIRKGIRYHNVPPVNGRELTAADVAYTVLRNKNTPKASPKWYEMVDTITATDKYTAVVKLKYPDYLYMETFGDCSVCPADYAPEMVAKYGSLNDWHNACGTGPWMIEDYVRGSVITYKRNPNYWMKDPFFPENTLPYADTAKILVIPDVSTRMAALRSGKLDVIIDHLFWTDADSLKKTNPEINQLAFASGAGSLSIHFRVDKPPFNDIRVRQAMLLAIDQKSINNDYLRGHGALYEWPMLKSWGEGVYTPFDKMPTQPTLPGSKCSVQELYTYNPTKAKQLLTEAGYPNGFETSVILQETEVDSTSLLAAYWAAVGVKLNLSVKTVAVKATLVQQMPKRTYPEDMAVQTVNSVGPSASWSSAFITSAGFNPGNLADAHIDQTNKDLNATPDPATRDKMNKDLALYILEQAYRIAGPVREEYNFWQPWVKNCEGAGRLTKWGDVQGMAFYWIDQNLKAEMKGR